MTKEERREETIFNNMVKSAKQKDALIEGSVIAPKNKWWGYKHTSGTYQAKRYFDQRDIEEANQSPFCETVVGPFDASDREEALSIIKQSINQ